MAARWESSEFDARGVKEGMKLGRVERLVGLYRRWRAEQGKRDRLEGTDGRSYRKIITDKSSRVTRGRVHGMKQ